MKIEKMNNLKLLLLLAPLTITTSTFCASADSTAPKQSILARLFKKKSSTPLQQQSPEDEESRELIKQLSWNRIKINKILDEDRVARTKDPKYLRAFEVWLLDHKDQINTKNKYGETPFYQAVLNNNIALAKLLVEQGAIIDIKPKGSRTVLSLAVKNNNPDMVRWLIELGADVDEVNKYGETPLFVAAATNADYAINGLLFPSDEERRHLFRYMPGDEFNRRIGLKEDFTVNNVAITKLLIEHGANVNKTNRDGMSPLMVAIWWGNLSVASELIDQGAYTGQRSKNGNTVFSLCRDVETQTWLHRTIARSKA